MFFFIKVFFVGYLFESFSVLLTLISVHETIFVCIFILIQVQIMLPDKTFDIFFH
jgi:hypothetical protein